MISKLPIDHDFYDTLISGIEDRSTVVIYLDAVGAGHPKPEDLAMRWETLYEMWLRYAVYGDPSYVTVYLEEVSDYVDWYPGGVRKELIRLRKVLVDELYEVETK